MIRKCSGKDLRTILDIINDAARAYEGVIPPDRWKDPYMPESYLRKEIDDGVRFWGYELDGKLVGVMGIQDVQDVTLIRHAYVRTAHRGKGIGSRLLSFLMEQATRPVLVGTWDAADWAVRFYRKHGFQLLPNDHGRQLLRKYWSIPDRQTETSVVLSGPNWTHEKARDRTG